VLRGSFWSRADLRFCCSITACWLHRRWFRRPDGLYAKRDADAGALVVGRLSHRDAYRRSDRLAVCNTDQRTDGHSDGKPIAGSDSDALIRANGNSQTDRLSDGDAVADSVGASPTAVPDTDCYSKGNGLAGSNPVSRARRRPEHGRLYAELER
jgi:hypothetical protein